MPRSSPVHAAPGLPLCALAAIRDAAAPLVRGRYLLAGDVPPLVDRAAVHWDALVPRPSLVLGR